MDDGSPIKLKITIDAENGEAVFDFDGTGPEVYGALSPVVLSYLTNKNRKHQRT
jgi:5-oxoprolinase (ATP-hydrolysing)